jgi:predicted outer membrane repeat protein
MMSFSLVDRTRRGIAGPNDFGRRRVARPRIEPLEERTLLSTWTVTDNSDSPTDTGSLRYAILNEPAGTTINFAYTVANPITLTTGVLNITKSLDIEGLGPSRLTINGNKASQVFAVAQGVTATIAGLTITGASGTFGGAILNDGTLTVSDSALANNSASDGAGIFNNTTLTVTSCTFSSNSASFNGGAIKNGGTLRVTNCTFSGNSASFDGGAIDNGDTLTLTNSTLSGNFAAFNGGGLDQRGRATLANTIIAGNRVSGTAGLGPDVYGTVSSLGHNLVGDVRGSSGWVSSDLQNVDPKLASLGNYGGPTQTMALMQGSPALNAGSASIPGVAVPTLDQRGALRGPAGLDAGDAPDIGAYEATSSYLVTTPTDSGAVGTLRSAVTWANLNVNVNKPKPVAVPTPLVPNTIVFDTKGAFGQSQTITLSPGLGPLTLTNSSVHEAIAGPGASVVTVSGGDKVQVFSISHPAITMIAGLTIAHGYSADYGGGIENGGTLTLINSAVSSNSAVFGGGGIFNLQSGTLTLTNSTVSANSRPTEGGGVYNRGTMTITDGTLSNNSASGTGGGIYNVGAASLAITNSTVSGDSSKIGGGIANEGSLTLTNSTLSGNSALNAGGGVANVGAARLTNCTLSGNSASSRFGGGGIDNLPAGAIGLGTVTLSNTIIAGNRLTGSGSAGTDASGKFNSLGHNLIGNNAGSEGWASSDLLNVDPKLGPLANNGGPTQTMALMPGSPAIGAGNVAIITNPPFPGPPFTDQRGLPRIASGKVDIGAFQSQRGASPHVAKPVQGKHHPVRGAKVVRIFNSPKTLTLVLSSRRLLA